MAGPSLLVAKETKTRLSNLKSGIKGLFFLPLTVGMLMTYVIFGKDYLSQIPILNLSWLGYNIALGPFGNQGLLGIFAVYTYVSIYTNSCQLI